MATWCLIKQYADAFRKALRDGTINPEKLTAMDSLERREFLAKYVGEENAKYTNALFESKLLLKNQQAGMISWAKKISGITPQRRNDLITRIERLERVLDPAENEQFLNDLASARLKIEVTQEEAKNIADMSRKITETKNKADSYGVFPSEEERLEYGASKVALENYVNDLKLESRKLTFKQKLTKSPFSFVTDIAGAAKSVKASLDNSFWGRQGISVLATPRTADIWFKNFIKSWGDIVSELKGINAMDAIRAEIYSRPNAVLGKYTVGGYGLDVLSEEAFPSSFPAKIPILKRLYLASESAYNGAALRLRADLADRFIALAEAQGINTMNKEEAVGIGHLVGSMTGRGSIGKGEVFAKEANVLFFSVKFLKANFDKLTAHQFDSKATPFARKEAAKNLLSIVATTAIVLGLAKLLDPDSVDEDPRSTNFGKIKIFGHWVDITGGMSGILTLASRMIPTVHEGEWGFWYKSKSGNWFKLGADEFMSAWDVLGSFFEGKLSPFVGVIRDIWKGEDYSGEPVTVSKTIKSLTTPLPIENMMEFIKHPESSFVIGSIILDQLGFSTSTNIVPNKNSQIIPTGVKVTEGDILSYVKTYARAMDIDPVTAFNRIFTGQNIIKVSDGGIIVVDRMSVKESQAYKKAWVLKNGGEVSDMKLMKLDHKVPLGLGGSESESNWQMVYNADWERWTPAENALIRAVKDGKIGVKDAQKLIAKVKESDVETQKKLIEEILTKYK